MKFYINDDIDVHALVERIKKLKAEGIARNAASRLGLTQDQLQPWAKSGSTRNDIWLELDKVYEWYMQDKNPLSTQAYRRLAESLGTYSCRSRGTWQNTITWIEAHGNPCLNEEWLQWQDSYVMAEY